MRAIVFDQPGGPEALTLREDHPDPVVGPDTVLIEVRAAGVNPVDFKIRQGALAERIKYHLPVVPGWDVAGVVRAVGPAVTRFTEGDEVWAYARKDVIEDGTCAELVGVREDAVSRKPEGLSFEEAGALPLAGLTALQALRDGVRLQGGERVVINGASGGVGHLAVQLAAAMGAIVVAVCSEANHAFVLELGAEEAYDYGQADLAAAIGVADAVVDCATGEAEPMTKLLTARLASIIAPPEDGTYIFVRPSAKDLDLLASAVDGGQLRVEVAETFPLERTADAHRRLEGGGVRGKLVVTV